LILTEEVKNSKPTQYQLPPKIIAPQKNKLRQKKPEKNQQLHIPYGMSCIEHLHSSLVTVQVPAHPMQPSSRQVFGSL